MADFDTKFQEPKVSEIAEIEVDILQPNPLQPRGLITPESLLELVDSIREHGILEPLVVAATPAGFQIIAGERRWRAAKLAGLRKVPAVIRETTTVGLLEMALVENVQRQDLSAIERAQAFKRLISEFGQTPTDLAKKIGKSIAYVSNSLRLLTLPDGVKDALISGATTEGHARALVSLGEDTTIIEGFKQVLAKNLSVRQTEELVRKMKSETAAPKQTWKTRGWLRPAYIEEIEKDLAENLSKDGAETKVKIWQSRIQAKILLSFSGPIEKTTRILEKVRNSLSSN